MSHWLDNPRCLTRPSSRPVLAALSFLLLLLSSLPADEPGPRDVSFADLQVGERVRVTNLRGSSFVGTVILRTPDSLRLDLSAERDGLNAWIGFRADSVKSIQLLTPLSEADVKAVREERRVQAERALEAARLKAGPPAGAPEKPELAERPVLTETQVMLLRTFPPDQWGPERLAEIRRRWIVQGLTPDPAESDFARFYPQWEDAVARIEALRQWELEHRDIVLLETFPPDKGWSSAAHEAIAARKAAGTALTEPEAEFLRVYPDWLKAWEEQQKAKEPAKTEEKQPEAPKPQGETPQTPAGEKQPEKPQEPAAEKPAEPAAEKPAEKPVEKPADAQPDKPVPDAKQP